MKTSKDLTHEERQEVLTRISNRLGCQEARIFTNLSAARIAAAEAFENVRACDVDFEEALNQADFAFLKLSLARRQLRARAQTQGDFNAAREAYSKALRNNEEGK